MEKLRTLQSLVETLSEHSGQAVILALHKGGVERWSYSELADHVQRLAHGLATAGVGCGDHVALLADNRPAWIIACLAVLKAGAVVVPVDVQFGSQVLGHILHDSGARVIFSFSSPGVPDAEAISPSMSNSFACTMSRIIDC